jgi:hypothetical protein
MGMDGAWHPAWPGRCGRAPGLGRDEPQLHQSAGRVVDERQQSTHPAAVFEPAVFRTVDLHEFAQTFTPSSRLMRGRQFVAAIDP